MILFEYITVAVSIVLSLSIVRMVGSVEYAFAPQSRYGVHTAWCAIKMFQPLLVWWSIWGLHDQEGWNFLAFVLCISSPALLYLQISTLVPDRADEVRDWRAHFYATKTRFFAVNIALALSGPLLLLVLGIFSLGPYLASAAALETILSVVALRSSNERVHIAIVAITGLGFLAWSALLFLPNPVGA